MQIEDMMTRLDAIEEELDALRQVAAKQPTRSWEVWFAAEQPQGDTPPREPPVTIHAASALEAAQIFGRQYITLEATIHPPGTAKPKPIIACVHVLGEGRQHTFNLRAVYMLEAHPVHPPLDSLWAGLLRSMFLPFKGVLEAGHER